MYRERTVAVVVPCFNEAAQISKVIRDMPNFIDQIVVIDDKSTDNTVETVKNECKINKSLILLQHAINQGVGGAIATGYKWCRDNNFDIAVVMAGDGQMLPRDLPKIINPVVTGNADYSKANRLISGEAYKIIPKSRYFGNAVLSFLTKIASGYWHVVDSQSGFTAINRKMLNLIDWDKMYKRYGQPNDLLVRLNVFSARICDVTVEPVYNIGEKSGIKIRKVIFTIPVMLSKMFFWRIKEKYIIRDFHPLVLFYFFGGVAGLVSLSLLARWFAIRLSTGTGPELTFLSWMLSTIAAIQFTCFAMWFDMDYNKSLKVIESDQTARS